MSTIRQTVVLTYDNFQYNLRMVRLILSYLERRKVMSSFAKRPFQCHGWEQFLPFLSQPSNIMVTKLGIFDNLLHICPGESGLLWR